MQSKCKKRSPPNRKSERSLRYVEQSPQLGTGHAVQQAEPLLDDASPTLVLYGDVPLIRPSTLRRLFSAGGDVALLTVQLAQPSGYGRIVRDWHGNVLRIVEERDADDDERKLTEVNTGILMAPTVKLKRWLKALSNENAQREYYLTDVIAHAVAEHCRVVGSRLRRSGRNARRQQQGAIGDHRAHRAAPNRERVDGARRDAGRPGAY